MTKEWTNKWAKEEHKIISLVRSFYISQRSASHISLGRSKWIGYVRKLSCVDLSIVNFLNTS